MKFHEISLHEISIPDFSASITQIQGEAPRRQQNNDDPLPDSKVCSLESMTTNNVAWDHREHREHRGVSPRAAVRIYIRRKKQ